MPWKHLVPIASVAVLVTASPCGAEDWAVLHQRGINALEAGDAEMAKDLLARARDGADAAGAPHQYFERSMVKLARAQQRHADYQQAEEHFRSAMRVREARLGSTHILIADLLGDLAVVTAAQDRVAEAAKYARRALSIQERQLGPTHLEVGVTLYRLASYVASLGDFDEATSLLDRSLEITNAALGNDRDIASALQGFAAMQSSAGRLSTAEGLLARAMAHLEADHADDHERVQILLGALGLAQEQQQNWSGARATYERAYAAARTDELAMRTWLTRAMDGDRTIAEEGIRRHAELRRPGGANDWTGGLVRFLSGQVDADALIASASVSDGVDAAERLSDAHFYIGARHLVDGNQQAALERFRECVAVDAHRSHPFHVAAAQLEVAEARVTQVDTAISPLDD